MNDSSFNKLVASGEGSVIKEVNNSSKIQGKKIQIYSNTWLLGWIQIMEITKLQIKFSNPKTESVFAELRLVFIKTLILYHFDWEHYIQVETDALDYAIGRVLS